MRLSKSRPSHWSQVSNRFIYGDPGPKKLDPPTEASSSPSDNSRNSAFAAMKACSSSGDISTPNSAHASQLLNRLDTRGAFHHLLLGCRHDDYPFLVRPRVATGVCGSVWEPLLPSASRRERTTDYSERTLVHGAERSRADGRGGVHFAQRKNVPMPRAPNARIAQCRGADGEIIEGSRGAAMVASFATTATMNTDQGISSFRPDFAQICRKWIRTQKGRKRFSASDLQVTGRGGQDLNLWPPGYEPASYQTAPPASLCCLPLHPKCLQTGKAARKNITRLS